MKAIKVLLNELSRCDVVNDFNGNLFYNGIGLIDSSMAFHKRLHRLYEDALIEIPLLSAEAKEGFINVIDRYAESQQLFDVPDESIWESMNMEIEAGNTNTNLITERDFVKMICECVSIQKYYLKEFGAAIGNTLTKEIATTPIDIKEEESLSNDTNLAKGVKGLAEHIGCGINTAQKIINSGILSEKKIQYRAGKSWRFRKDKLTELLEIEPEIFRKVD